MPKRKIAHITQAVRELEKAAIIFGIEEFKQTTKAGKQLDNMNFLQSLSMTLLHLGYI